MPEYPWDEWLDGQIRQLERGDLQGEEPEAVITMAAEEAQRRGLTLKSTMQDGDAIIQACKPEHKDS